MCGITAILGTWTLKEAEQAGATMLRTMSHRGPDDEGLHVATTSAGAIAMGNRRLAIQDLSPAGHQPMTSAEGVVIVYNGETYNAPQLRAELEAMGASFRGHSDTEVILEGYLRWGRGVLPKLVGMFAIAIWDPRSGRLLVARDHLGIKPLYYAALPEGVILASEVKALERTGLVPADIDRRAVAGYLAYGAVPEPLTILASVRVLSPGSWMEFDASGRLEAGSRYWRFPEPARRPRDQIVREGRARLATAVERHMLSDVPVGVFMSSGLDSTTVAGFASRSGNLRAYTVAIPQDASMDEAGVAARTARRFRLPHVACPVSAEEALALARRSLDAQDQPALDGFNVHLISAAVRREGIVVALSGQGGDELFGGYRSFVNVPRWRRQLRALAVLPRGIRGGVLRSVAPRRDETARAKAADIGRAGPDLVALYHQFRRLHSDDDMRKLGLDAQELGLGPSYHVAGSEGRDLLVEGDDVATIARLELAHYLRDTLLREGDVQGMANSVEIRVPFLDRELVEWALTIPGDVLRPARGPNKPLLREMAADLLDPSQTAAAKRGFSLPFSEWLRGPLRPLAEDALAELKSSGLVRPSGVDCIWQRFLAEPDSSAWSRVWALVSLGSWLARRDHAGRRSAGG